jgi:protease-4
MPSNLGLVERASSRLGEVLDRRRIAVVPLRGVIGGAVRTGDLIGLINRARDAERVRAVLLDIHSPGGDAVASEAIYRAVKRLRERKPVVAWIRGTGASGAYFVACGATRMLAFPGAVVGSIGVISARPVLVEALRRVGASVLVTKTGPFKDLGAPWREATEEDREKERALVDGVFRRFTGVVREARGFDDASLARVTTGEVWLAEEAVELRLIDAVCDEEEALDEAQKLAGIPRRIVTRLQSRRTLMQRVGMPMAGMGPPGPRWIAELEGWMRTPRARLL